MITLYPPLSTTMVSKSDRGTTVNKVTKVSSPYFDQELKAFPILMKTTAFVGFAISCDWNHYACSASFFCHS